MTRAVFSCLMIDALRNRRIALAAVAFLSVLMVGLQARTWTSADGSKTFEGKLQAYDAVSGKVSVILPNGKSMTFQKDLLSENDIGFLSSSSSRPGKVEELPEVWPDPDGKEADMSKPVQVYILLGQSNMLGFGKPQVLQ